MNLQVKEYEHGSTFSTLILQPKNTLIIIILTFSHKTLEENMWPSDLHRTIDPVKLIELFYSQELFMLYFNWNIHTLV